MSERPILFSGAMVRAILDGRKTQTRRVVKPQPVEGVYKYGGVAPTFQWRTEINTCRPIWPDVMNQYCPYGQPGDYLWVRETHAIVPTTAYRASEGVDQTINPCEPSDAAIYREGWTRSAPGVRWRPSIHMSRWASRILLEVVSVRVEQLRDISEKDAIAEGVVSDFPVYAYADLWDSINEKRDYGWVVDPWVWVVEFKQVTV